MWFFSLGTEEEIIQRTKNDLCMMHSNHITRMAVLYTFLEKEMIKANDLNELNMTDLDLIAMFDQNVWCSFVQKHGQSTMSRWNLLLYQGPQTAPEKHNPLNKDRTESTTMSHICCLEVPEVVDLESGCKAESVTCILDFNRTFREMKVIPENPGFVMGGYITSSPKVKMEAVINPETWRYLDRLKSYHTNGSRPIIDRESQQNIHESGVSSKLTSSDAEIGYRTSINTTQTLKQLYHSR